MFFTDVARTGEGLARLWCGCVTVNPHNSVVTANTPVVSRARVTLMRSAVLSPLDLSCFGECCLDRPISVNLEIGTFSGKKETFIPETVCESLCLL